jgi:hypothetical protein
LKPLLQAKQGDVNRLGVVMNNRRPQPSNAGRKNTGLSTTTITLSTLLPREKVVAGGEFKKPCVVNAVRPKPFGKVIEKFERVPCARTSLPPIAKIAVARARRISIRRIAANMIAIRPPHNECIMQTIHIIAHEDGVGEVELWHKCEGCRVLRWSHGDCASQ